MPESVRLISDPVLRKKCAPADPSAVGGLLDRMFEVMKAENGIGLAANQIGHSVRVFITKDDQTYREYINPEIVSQTEPVDFEGEACLSIPGTSATTKRFRCLKLTWSDRHGTKKEGDFFNLDAFAIQHEMDHLNGKLYVDQFGSMKRDMVLSKHRKFLRRG